MKELLLFILENITGSKSLEIKLAEDGDHLTFEIVSPKEFIGLIIGKQGKTVKAIRNILKIKATLEKKTFTLNISEKES